MQQRGNGAGQKDCSGGGKWPYGTTETCIVTESIQTIRGAGFDKEQVWDSVATVEEGNLLFSSLLNAKWLLCCVRARNVHFRESLGLWLARRQWS